MGIYDRDYYREERGGLVLRSPRTVVTWLILINVGIYLIDALFFPLARGSRDIGEFCNLLAAHDQTLLHPWMWWQLLTSGFAHARTPMHVGFNMLQLYFLGRPVEARYGWKEFLRIYLAMIVVGSLTWAIPTTLTSSHGAMCGASGAVTGIVFLFVLNYPHQTLVLFPIPIPIKAWVVGAMLIVMNLFIAMDPESVTAWEVHLAGVAFAFVYFRFGWNLGRLWPRGISLNRFKPGPRLRVHDPGLEEHNGAELGDEVDRILEKIHEQGEASLTRKERRTLQTASRQYQKKRHDSE